MVHCQACGITTKARNYGITFHRFPKNESQRSTWISFVNKETRSHKTFNCTTLCSQHFEKSCFDKTSELKVRLKPFSMPTIHISRSRYDKIFTTVTAMTVSQPESDNKSLLVDTVINNTSTDVTGIKCGSNTDISGIVKDSIIITDTSKRMDIISEPPDRNANIKLLSSTGLETNVQLNILPNDSPNKVALKNKIISLGWSLAEKSTAMRKLQKKVWNQRKQIFKLKSVIHELRNKTSY